MKYKWFAYGACLISILFSTTGAYAEEQSNKLILTGSSTVAPLLAEIAKRYEKNNPGVRIDVQTGGSTRGINDARTGQVDIGMASRAPKKSEENLKFFTVARDGIAIILNSANPIATLTDDQIKLIYTGKITRWSQLAGGPDKEVIVVNKADGRSTLELFLKHFKLKPEQVKAHVIIGDNQQGIKTVIANPYSIGYVSIGAAHYEASQGAPLKLLPMNGVVASMDTVARGKYPLSRPLNIITSKQPSGLTKQFIDFALSGDVHDIIEQQYFVPVNH